MRSPENFLAEQSASSARQIHNLSQTISISHSIWSADQNRVGPRQINGFSPLLRGFDKSSKYLHNVAEADHGKLKQLIRPVRGFKTLKTAYATIKGFEVMRALRKGQASSFNITRGIPSEARLVERAFNLGRGVLAEAVQFIGQQLELQDA